MTKKNSDLSMNWALQKSNLKRTSIYKAISSTFMKKQEYLCEGCQPYNHEVEVRPAKYTPPYYRKKANQSHSLQCKYRNPQAYISVVASQFQIQLREQIILFDSLSLFQGWKYSTFRREYVQFFKSSDTVRITYFLGHMVKELELSSLQNHYAGYHFVSRGNHFSISLRQLIGYQDDVIRQINEAQLQKCLAFVVGKIDWVERNEINGYMIIHFTVHRGIATTLPKGNTQAFRLFVPSEHRDIVGDVNKLTGSLIGCFGVAEKHEASGFYQMTLFSVDHQIVNLDLEQIERLPEQINHYVEPSFDNTQIPKEIHQFVKNVWSGNELDVQQTSKFFDSYYGPVVRSLHKQLPDMEREKNEFAIYLEENRKVESELKRLERERRAVEMSFLTNQINYKKYDTFLQRGLLKLGLSKKLQEAKEDMESSHLELNESSRNVQRMAKLYDQLQVSRSAWEKRSEQVNQFEEHFAKFNKLALMEQEYKVTHGSRQPLIFRLPLRHSYWDLILHFDFLETDNSVSIKGKVQLYHLHEGNWLPMDHPAQLKEVVLEPSPRESLITKKQLNQFYSKIGEEIKEKLILLGIDKHKLQCPKCKRNTRILYDKRVKFLLAACWDNECKGSNLIQFSEVV